MPARERSIDEAEDQLGTHMCIPPHWDNRRAEIAQLEPIRTVEPVAGGTGADPARRRLRGGNRG